jgi:hypothetical protein
MWDALEEDGLARCWEMARGNEMADKIMKRKDHGKRKTRGFLCASSYKT